MPWVLPLTAWVLLGSLFGAAQDPPQEMSGPFAVQVTSDEVSYFRLRVPKSLPNLHIFVQATNEPVIWALAVGYWPKESHFDVSNFPSWARGSLRSDVLLNLANLRSPCEDPEGILQQCFARAQSGDVELACGENPKQSQQGYGEAASLCRKRLGSCSQSACTEHLQGPTRCDANRSSDEGQCLCQQGFCADVSGRFCIEADMMQLGCEKITGRACNVYECDPAFGRAVCENGLCVCAPGHCSVNGVCQPGPICQESDEYRFCEQPVATQGAVRPDVVTEGSSRPTDPPVSHLSDACCQILSRARKRDPGSFNRCVAAHFYSVESQKKHGVQANLLTDMTNGGEAFDELVFMIRSASPGSNFREDAKRHANPNGMVRFCFSLVLNNTSDFVGLSPWPVTYSMPLRLRELELFRRFEELVNPIRSPFGQRALQLHEIPLSTGGVNALGQSMVPPTPIQFRSNELVLLRDRSSDMHGDLKLHLRGLPAGSTVLYSRTSPWLKPRSLLDFDHAEKVVVHNPARRLPQAPPEEALVKLPESVWMARQKNARYFAILPATEGYAMGHFTGSLERDRPQYPVPFIPSPNVASEPKPTMSPDFVHDVTPHWISAAWLGLTFAISVLAIVRWILRRDSLDTEGTIDLQEVLDTPRRLARRVYARTVSSVPERMYMPVSRSEHELVDSGEPDVAIAESDDDSALSARGTKALCPKAPSLSSLKVFGAEVKKRLWAAGQLTRRGSFLDTEDEDSDGTPRKGRRSSADCEEAKGLLSHEEEEDEGFRPFRGRAHSPEPICRGSRKVTPQSPIDMGSNEDFEAMQALLKLRPAARDSVGDDTLEDVDGPLMGTDRSAMLKR